MWPWNGLRIRSYYKLEINLNGHAVLFKTISIGSIADDLIFKGLSNFLPNIAGYSAYASGRKPLKIRSMQALGGISFEISSLKEGHDLSFLHFRFITFKERTVLESTIGTKKEKDVIKALVDDEYLIEIHKDAMRVLEEVGVKCESPEIIDVFTNTGLAAFDDVTGHIHVLTPLVEQALNSAPKRDQYWVPENSFGVGGTAPFVYDDQSGELVEPTFDHLTSIAKIVNQSDVVKFMARGVLIKKQEVKVMDAIIDNCDKPIYVAAVTEAGIARAKEIHETRGNITVQFSIINSPLNIIESMVDPFLSCVKSDIPIYVSTMPMAGLSGPYSMSGLLTLTHAEALFGITLSQIINPGLMVVHAGLPSIANIQKNYAVDLGLVSHNIANLLMEKVCKVLGLPSIQTACTTNDEHPGKRAEEQAVTGYSIMKKYGFHQMRHSFGFLKELVSFSIAKLERHIDLCEETGPEQAPQLEIEPYDDGGFDVIMKNGSKANYMRDDHTLKNTGKSFLN